MRYGSDLSDEQWEAIKEFTGRSDPRGARRKHEMREVLNAIFYVLKTGCQWRQLPVHYPPWKTVYDHYARMKKRGIWEAMSLELNKRSRKKRA